MTNTANAVGNVSVLPVTQSDVAANAAFEFHNPVADVPRQLTGSEEEHIKRALEASQTAMDAIGTVTNLATYTLTILGIIIGLVALVGGYAIYRSAKAQAERIANERFDVYIKTDNFKELVKVKIERSINERWQESEGSRLEEEIRDPADPQPFDPPPPNPPPPGEAAQ
jgi:hypothetical protein